MARSCRPRLLNSGPRLFSIPVLIPSPARSSPCAVGLTRRGGGRAGARSPAVSSLHSQLSSLLPASCRRLTAEDSARGSGREEKICERWLRPFSAPGRDAQPSAAQRSPSAHPTAAATAAKEVD
ncbi:Hypothetical predicted protein [Marmota monax]|uniref:Uncharacterized protein n=1 Tax=Marmota monax TaxID=9995 RepID=A0A5E4A0V1_MARMO|nr:Hypothetical predicted protein [Marmota monax]